MPSTGFPVIKPKAFGYKWVTQKNEKVQNKNYLGFSWIGIQVLTNARTLWVKCRKRTVSFPKIIQSDEFYKKQNSDYLLKMFSLGIMLQFGCFIWTVLRNVRIFRNIIILILFSKFQSTVNNNRFGFKVFNMTPAEIEDFLSFYKKGKGNGSL